MERRGDENLNNYARGKNSEIIYLCAKLELDLQELGDKNRENYLQELGMGECKLNELIRTCFKALSLITFFTIVGEKEARAWGIKSGTTAQDAAGKIHQDINEGFIKAEVINYNQLIKAGNMSEAREKGLLGIEGKDYIVQEDDVINFKFR